MKNNFILILACIAGITVSCNKGTPVIVKSNPASSTGDVVGKITVGYQGWFNAPNDGSPYVDEWRHTNLEMWPDTREYTKLYGNVQFAQEGNDAPVFTGTLGNGQPAKMFSSYDQSTVSLHFKWMQQYGIDCAALQRFANEITPGSPDKANRDAVAQRVRIAAEATNRKFYIMYDASGWGDLNELKTDWTNTITGSLNLLSSTAYAKQNNKPVVCIYGLAYNGHPATPAKALDLVNWFKSKGCYVIGSLPGEWRGGFGDAAPGYTNFYKALNMISAWAVGRVPDDSYRPWVEGDRDFCNANHIDYQPCIYPGTAFHNSNGSDSPKNGIPRAHGDFMWAQFATLKNAGVRSAYVAMFDELNEATSIFKVAEDNSMIPKGQYFLTLDADGTHVSSDFYLRLVQDGAKMLNGTIPYTAKEPTPFIVGK
ncbi:MAG: glycoside hydrolase family 71/99-like protein [Mucilaginibacter sp.]|uniref:glycoside hydrolase family 71/99-like protein n=1 Tax=Mucilaginibacter sp. TaxID=1882438 RepID=UPI0031B15F0D